MTAKLSTPGKIVAVDLDDSRLAKALEFGADNVINNGRENAPPASARPLNPQWSGTTDCRPHRPPGRWEHGLWLVAFPWLLRILLVAAFAIGWTLISIPRTPRRSGSRAERLRRPCARLGRTDFRTGKRG